MSIFRQKMKLENESPIFNNTDTTTLIRIIRIINSGDKAHCSDISVSTYSNKRLRVVLQQQEKQK